MANVGRKAYPIVISKEDDGFYYVEIPDFDIATQGESVPDAMEMARDAIGLMGIDFLMTGREYLNRIQRNYILRKMIS